MKVGFIGLGRMGGGMAQNLIKAGHTLTVHDVRREAANPHVERGAAWAASPVAATEALTGSPPGSCVERGSGRPPARGLDRSPGRIRPARSGRGH